MSSAADTLSLDPADGYLYALIDSLAPLFAGPGRDQHFAAQAACNAFQQYRIRDAADLPTIARLIAFTLGTLKAIAAAATPGLSPDQHLRLLTRATACNRAVERAEAALRRPPPPEPSRPAAPCPAAPCPAPAPHADRPGQPRVGPTSAPSPSSASNPPSAHTQPTSTPPAPTSPAHTPPSQIPLGRAPSGNAPPVTPHASAAPDDNAAWPLQPRSIIPPDVPPEEAAYLQSLAYEALAEAFPERFPLPPPPFPFQSPAAPAPHPAAAAPPHRQKPRFGA